MDTKILTSLIGKEIQLYPGDTYPRWGIIKEVDDVGFSIKITKADARSIFKVGSTYFMTHGDKIVLKF